MRETAAMAGLEINIQKTKSLRVNQGNNANFDIGGDKIKDIKKFTYLYIFAALSLARVEQIRTL